MDEFLLTNLVVAHLSPVPVTQILDIASVWSKQFFGIQEVTHCKFVLTFVCDTIKTQS